MPLGFRDHLRRSLSARGGDLRAPAAFWAGACAVAAFGLACHLDSPTGTPVLHFKLSEETRKLDENGEPLVPPKEQEHIRGALEMLFGSPAHPQFMLLSNWAEEGFNPNYPLDAKDDGGGGEFADADKEAFQAENSRRFAETLARIEAGRYADVRAPDQAPDLRDSWLALLRAREGGMNEEEFKTQAKDLFVNWYPTLRDSAELYRQQCLHCHGVEGGADGPTARFLDPLPRDYRRGVFKFTAVKDKSQPRRHDLYRVLDQGVTGTAMPSFRRFTKTELNGLVDYVRLLSMRGMVERDLVATYINEEPITPEYIVESYSTVWDKWGKAADKFFKYDGDVPPSSPESIERGRAVFMDATKGNCFSCHGAKGRGDGESAFKNAPKTDAHGAPVLDHDGKPMVAKVSAYQDDWGHDILPRNITQGLFRGGKRPIDVYRRIYAGINGGPMPAIGESKDAEGHPVLTSEQMWDLVHYVLSLTEYPRAHHE
jgi:mono/diheme cytochrome c family protein